MPNEDCPEPTINGWFHQGNRPVEVEDPGAGNTTVTTYGTAIREVPMPRIKDGMSGLSVLYHSKFRFDVSYSAWGTGTSVVGGSIPVPNLDTANLNGADPNLVQPRPGTMPGLYLYQPDGADEFFHYGGPTESGASPQSTAHYDSPNDGGIPSAPDVYTNQLSGAELWHYNAGAGGSSEYVEVKHVDGTVARFEHFNPYSSSYTPSGTLWRIDKVTDPYDNVADYSYDTSHRLETIDFPSGLRQRFDYNPSWSGWTWSSTTSGVRIRYRRDTGGGGGYADLAGQTWGIVFKNANGSSGGTHFALRLHRIYSATRKIQRDESTADSPYTASAVDGQVVHEFEYTAPPVGDINTASFVETNRVHVGTTAFHQTITTDTDLDDLDVITTLLDAATGQVKSQYNELTTQAVTITYTSTGVRTTDLLTGESLTAAVVKDGEDNERRYEYHSDTGKLYSTIITADPGAIGTPRDHAGFAATESEPDKIHIYRIFDGTCDCQKPIEVRTIATRNGSDSTRTTYYEYFTPTKLLKKRSVPNPSTAGSAPSHVDYTYTYQQAVTGGQLWGAWLPSTEVTPDGTWIYEYDDWLNRSDSTQHGRIPGEITRRITGVRIQNSLTGTPATNSTVSQVLYRNLSNSPGGLAQSGSVSGQPRRIVDGDGVETTFEYTTEGWLEVEWEHGATTKRVYAHNSTTGNVTSITDRATASTDHKLVWSFTSQSGFGAPYEAESTSADVAREVEYYYDRFGHLAIRRQNNLDSDGNGPSKHGSTSTPRAWVESQWHYQHHQLWDTYVDRQPLDEAVASSQFLQTLYSYRSNGQLEEVKNPNGSVTKYQFDGYGTLFTSTVEDPTAAATVTRPRRLVNEFLELTKIFDEVSASDDLQTILTRNGAGAVTKVVEPETDDPYVGFPGSTGGAVHQFEVDELGRVTEARSYNAGETTQFTEREIRYDQLSRKIWQRDEVMGFGSGDRYTAWRFEVNKQTWLDTVETTGIDPTTYDYVSTSGFLDKVIDGLGASTADGNVVEYDYHTGTSFVSTVTRTDQDPLAGSGTRVTSTDYEYDPFGSVLKIISNGTTDLEHAYAYNSLGRVDHYTDPASRVQKFLPDGLGRIVEHVRVGDSGDYIRNRTEFLDSGSTDGRTKVTRYDDLSHATITHYDFAGRPFIVQNPGASTVPAPLSENQPFCLYAEYDLASRLSAVYDGDDGKTVYWRDGRGRLIMRQLDELDANVISTWNSKDVIERDDIGRIKVTQIFGGGPAFAHGFKVVDEEFDIDSLGRTHEERYDFAPSANNVLEVTSAFSGGNPYRSDLDYGDNLTSGSAPLSMDFAHDDIGRLTGIDWTGTGSSADLADYGWAGALRRTRDVRYGSSADGATEFDYDEHDRLIGITDTIDDGTPAIESEFTYEYDAASNLTKEWYDKVDGSKGDRFGYDAYHRLTSAAMGASTTIMNGSMPTGHVSGLHSYLTYGLDGANNREDTSIDTGGGATTTNYNLQGSTHPQGESNRYDTIGSSTPLTTLTYDDRGNLTFDGQFYYCYDFLNRLQEVYVVTDAESSSSSSSSSASSSLLQGSSSTTRYAVSGQSVLQAAREDIREGISNFETRVITEHMDPTFRARLRASVPGGGVRITGSSLGGGGMLQPPLASLNMTLVALYMYDAFNRRVLTAVSGEATTFHTWDGWRQTGEFEQVEVATSSYEARPTKQFVWGSRLDELASYRVNDAGTWENYFVLHGGQDTAAKLVDSVGALVETYEYDPYGRASVYVGSSTTPQLVSSVGLPFLWKGVRLDPETGLLQMRNRYYSTRLARFLHGDPIGVWGDSSNLGNQYSYVGNMPGVSSDPMGLQGENGNVSMAFSSAPLGIAMGAGMLVEAFGLPAIELPWLFTAPSAIPGPVVAAGAGAGIAALFYSPFAIMAWHMEVVKGRDGGGGGGGGSGGGGPTWGISPEGFKRPVPPPAVAPIPTVVPEPVVPPGIPVEDEPGPACGPVPDVWPPLPWVDPRWYVEGDDVVCEDKTYWRIYRIHGGRSPYNGPYWSFYDPRGTDARADFALPPWNTGDQLEQGILYSLDGVTVGFAEPAFGQPGGGPEVYVPFPDLQIVFLGSTSVSPPF